MKFTVASGLVNLFEEKLNKFQRKFQKYGNGVISYTKSEPYICEDKNSSKYLCKVVDMDVEGDYKVEGFGFVAALDFDEESKMNIVRKSPETPNIPERFVTRCQCDHCKINRERKYTVLLHNEETGEYIQVGKSCLKDYLGKDIVDYASYLDLFSSLEEYLEEIEKKSNPPHIAEYVEVKEILIQAAVDSRKNGYISKKMIQDWYEKNDPEGEYGFDCPFTTTASHIYAMISNPVKNPKYKEEDITEEDKQMVENVINFVNENKEESDYSRNLYILINKKYVLFKDLGLVVSAVGSYIRETKKNEKKEDKEESEFIGNVGEKIEITAKPECVFSTDTQYGMCYIYRFMVGKDVVVWKTGKRIDTEKEITIKATVKDHNVYRNTKQTEVTRAKVVV